jgi:hypothetical protein
MRRMMRTSTGPVRPIATALSATLLVALGAGAARAQTVVQIPLPGVLDTRGVITLTNGVIVPFTLTIDGGGNPPDVGMGGLQNGFATKAVAMMKSPANVANSLPDDGHFPADTRHPDVVLNFSNTADPTSPQNHLVKPMGGMFTFPVPPATYSKLFLFFHGADGGTTVKITLTYSDATTDVTMATIGDFGNGSVPPANGNVFVLVGNLAKWSKTATIAEAGNHNIFGVEVDPMAKGLSMVKVERGATGYLVFWGATGVATGAVGTLPDAGATDAGGAGSGGAAGAAGTGGAAGAAGSGGSAGAGGAAGGGTAGATAGTSGAGTAGAAGTSAGAAGTSGPGTAGGGGSAAAGSVGSTGASGSHGATGGGSGCACHLGARETGGAGAAWVLLVAAGLVNLARRRRR